LKDDTFASSTPSALRQVEEFLYQYYLI
jgi:hypothetical protein